jgi:murein DD-endopeptidase MepM/ murein hydrolase activator NlpD
MEQGISQAFRIARRIGSRVLRRVIIKIIAVLLPILTPYVAAFLIIVFVFGFVYFAMFMLPRFIAEGTASPAVIYNYGNSDQWKLSKDIELYKKYRKIDDDWQKQFRSYNTLAYQKPDSISGNGANQSATVSNVWGDYMATSFKSPSMALDNKYNEIFIDKAQKYNIDVKLLKSLAYAESSFNPNVISSANCVGIMQLSQDKINEYGITNPFDPEQNIDGGARYLAYLLDKFKDTQLAVAAYNAGPGAVEKYDGIPPYPETESHVRKVMQGYRGNEYATPISSEISYIVAEQDQVMPYRVPWSMMASLDRVLGDPIITGNHGYEVEEKGRKPLPDERFKELEPTLKWKDFQLYYYHSWEEEIETDEGTKTIVYVEKYKHNLKLLSTVDAYDAHYTYTWGTKNIKNGDDEDFTEIRVPELDNIERNGPYYQRVKDILAQYGLTKTSDTELVIRLAMNMDPDFQVDANLTSELMELNTNTEQVTYNGGTGELAWPVNGPITSPFGYRVHPITKKYRLHSGIDIGVPSGTPVHSADNGIVVFLGVNGGYGNCIMIDHGKYRTLYGHLSAFKVSPGQEVKKGDVIALSGNSGMSDGPHLHFEVRTGTNKTEFLNPLNVLGRQ